MKRALFHITLMASLIGCGSENAREKADSKREDPVRAESALAEAIPSTQNTDENVEKKQRATMPTLVDILMKAETRRLDWFRLDSIKRITPTISFPNKSTGNTTNGTWDFQFGTHKGETDRLDLVLSYAKSTDSLVTGQAIDCQEGRSSYSKVLEKLELAFGKPTEGKWEVEEFILDLSIAKPDTSCYGLSLDSKSLYEGDYD